MTTNATSADCIPHKDMMIPDNDSPEYGVGYPPITTLPETPETAYRLLFEGELTPIPSSPLIRIADNTATFSPVPTRPSPNELDLADDMTPLPSSPTVGAESTPALSSFSLFEGELTPIPSTCSLYGEGLSPMSDTSFVNDSPRYNGSVSSSPVYSPSSPIIEDEEETGSPFPARFSLWELIRSRSPSQGNTSTNVSPPASAFQSESQETLFRLGRNADEQGSPAPTLTAQVDTPSTPRHPTEPENVSITGTPFAPSYSPTSNSESLTTLNSPSPSYLLSPFTSLQSEAAPGYRRMEDMFADRAISPLDLNELHSDKARLESRVNALLSENRDLSKSISDILVDNLELIRQRAKLKELIERGRVMEADGGLDWDDLERQAAVLSYEVDGILALSRNWDLERADDNETRVRMENTATEMEVMVELILELTSSTMVED